MLDIQEMARQAARPYVLAAWRDFGIKNPDEDQIEIMRQVMMQVAEETDRDY